MRYLTRKSYIRHMEEQLQRDENNKVVTTQRKELVNEINAIKEAIENKKTNTIEEEKKNRNYSLPRSFIEDMIKDPTLNETFWKIADEEPEMKVGMLIALTKREIKIK